MIPIKIPFFAKLKKIYNKIHQKEQTSISSQENMKAKSDRLGEGHLAISDTKTYKAPKKNGTVKWRDKTDQ